jgi:hypothetical protein
MNRSNRSSRTTGRRQIRAFFECCLPLRDRAAGEGPAAKGSLSRTTPLFRRPRRIAGYWGRTDRKGSVLLVVIGLLLLLMLIGFTFFTFAAQENVTAEYYADASKNFAVADDADKYWDWGLEQLILGPRDYYTQSALWPGRHSLVPNMLGMFTTDATGYGLQIPYDAHPFNGTGYNVISTSSGQPLIDQNADGMADSPVLVANELLTLNFSQFAAQYSLNRAQLLNPAAYSGVPLFPTIDAGYTYPDLNNVFLASIRINPTTGNPDYITPSFHRPQYLRSGGTPIADWYQNVATGNGVLRPHPNHNILGTPVPTPAIDAQGQSRFLTTARTSAYNPPYSTYLGARTIQPFPFAVDANGNTIYGEQGVWSASGTPAANLDNDVDNDNDGYREGIWLDLGFPPIQLADGRTAVPLFSFTVIDADGLLNTNLHGNLAGLFDMSHPLGANGTGTNQPASRSNQGLSPCEVSPWWALSADPTSSYYFSSPDNPVGTVPLSALQQYRAFFGLNNTIPAQFGVDRIEAANMDIAFMLFGRGKYAVAPGGPPESFTLSDLIDGRWGENQLLLSATQQPNPKPLSAFPLPGMTGADDDNDRYAGINDYDPYLSTQPLYQFPAYGNQMIPPNGHPLDNSGNGFSVQSINYGSGYVRAPVLVSDPGNPTSPVQFLQYNGYSSGSQYQGQNLSIPGYLSQNQNSYGMIDEGDEVVADRRYQTQFGAYDQIFSPDEIAGLHLSAADYTAILGSSRLRQLMPFNLELNLQAKYIRSRFTTESWDRREHGFSYCTYPATPPNSNRGNWEFGGDWDGNYNSMTGIGANEFPPMIPTASLGASATQPFRMALAALISSKLPTLGVENPPMTPGFVPAAWYRQLRHNINRLLTTPIPATQAAPVSMPTASNGSNPLIYRQLTPHPDLLQGGFNQPIPGSPGASQVAPTTYNPGASPMYQEYWARRDRQEMARDIYVLLYMLGGSNDTINPTTTANSITAVGPPVQRQIYHDWQLAEMAQFAVNVVDALDRDDVITRFEYDKNLADGWNLDDNPYTTNDPIVSTDRGYVYGVEAQSLTLSEGMCIKQTAAVAGDNPLTTYNDQLCDRYFTFVELRNVGANPVYLQDQMTGLANGQWRVRLRRPSSATAPDYSVVLKYDGLNNRSYIPPDALFTIGSVARATVGDGDTFDPGSGTVYRGSDLRLDFDNDSRFNRIVPDIVDLGPLINADTPPGTNLDLVHLRDWNNNHFTLIEHNTTYPLSGPSPSGGNTTGTDVSTTRGKFGNFISISGNAGVDTVQFVLERRVHLNRTTPNLAADPSGYQDADNPWVVVDVLQDTYGALLPQIQNFVLASTDNATTAITALQQLVSVERGLPLDRSITAKHAVTAIPTAPYSNTIGAAVNSNTPPAPHVLWQPHFDRDFASVMELLSVPLYGPDEVTARLAWTGRLITEMSYATAPPQSPSPNQYQANVAIAKFAQPNNKSQPQENNRWYRILELLEFPTRADKQVQDNQAGYYLAGELNRVPARINLNTLRHPEVLMGLLDDPNLFDYYSLQELSSFEPARDWWQQLIGTRDGIDPVANAIIPGSPVSRPFRDFSQAGAPLAATPNEAVFPGFERSMLRRLPYDSEDVNDNNTTEPGENIGSLVAVNTTPINATYPSGSLTNTRRLFEARSRNDMLANNSYVDPHTRNRLLQKVSNNSTSRSNVFIVWMTVGFFDGYYPDQAGYPTAVQIGAEMTDQPRRRGFFVIDRSLLEDAYDVQTGSFDVKKFVQYRKTIQ